MSASHGWGRALNATASRLLLVTRAIGIPTSQQWRTSFSADGIALASGSRARTIGCWMSSRAVVPTGDGSQAFTCSAQSCRRRPFSCNSCSWFSSPPKCAAASAQPRPCNGSVSSSRPSRSNRQAAGEVIKLGQLSGDLQSSLRGFRRIDTGAGSSPSIILSLPAECPGICCDRRQHHDRKRAAGAAGL